MDTDLPPISDTIPKYILEGLAKQSSSTLREIAHAAERIADHKEAAAEREQRREAVDERELPEDLDHDEIPDDADAPRSATITKKTIDGNDYFYYQWKEDGKTKSEYIRPVNPKR